ncbi:MAG: hypothetical protein AAGA81_18125 [Acidobacteriota bacterium]
MTLDFAILGSGHEALVAACYLARAGRSVAVFGEAHDSALAARTVRGCDDVFWSVAPEDLGLLHDSVLEELELAKHGLASRAWPVFAVAGVDALPLCGTEAPSSLGRVFADAAALRRRLEGLLTAPFGEAELAHFALDPELLAQASLSVEEQLSTEVPPTAAEALRVLGTWGQQLSPVDQGTGLLLSLQIADAAGPRDHRTATTIDSGLVASLERCAEAAGVERRSSANGLWLEGGEVLGVRTGDETVAATHVLSSFDARRTYLDWVGRRHLPLEFVRALESTRYRSGLARLAVLLDGDVAPPRSDCVRWIVAEPGTADHACEQARSARQAQRPWLDVTWTSSATEGSAPSGTTLLTVSAQSFSYALSDQRDRGAIEALLLARLSVVVPEIGERLLECELVLPEDLEERFGWTEGHLHGGEMGLDQLFALRGRGPDLRPSHEWLSGLELCSGSVHPGGLTLGLVGRSCAARHLEAEP